jgi:hypothetical protein
MALYNIETMQLGVLYQMRDKFRVYPTCQREKVWTLTQKQKLIDTALRGLPIPPLAYVAIHVPLIGLRRELVDGQQRFETFIEYLNNEFPTGKAFSTEESQPVFSGRKYCELDQETRSNLENYRIPILNIEGMDEEYISLMFRRWQGGTPLTYAEKLFSYEGAAKNVAVTVANHRFWDVYNGRKIRKEPFQLGIKTILLELADGFANLTTPRQLETLTRMEVSRHTEMSNNIKRRMDGVLHLFEGYDFTAVNQVICAYQCVYLLEQSGYKWSTCEKGILTEWYMGIKLRFGIDKTNGIKDGWAMMDKVVSQREFWEENWSVVADLADSGKRDTKRFAEYQDKLQLWITQKSLCSICGKYMMFRDAVAHHVVQHSVGGATSIDNLQMVHKRCHENLHSRNGNQCKLPDPLTADAFSVTLESDRCSG